MDLRVSINVFFFNDTATTEIYTLSLHDALPICYPVGSSRTRWHDSNRYCECHCTSSVGYAPSYHHPLRSRSHPSIPLRTQHSILNFPGVVASGREPRIVSTQLLPLCDGADSDLQRALCRTEGN